MKIGVLLSGCGVYDGAEIQETVLSLLAIAELGHEAVCIGVDVDQFHVINHIDGSLMPEKRNMLIEAARITRGEIQDIHSIQPADIDALLIPGGFGSAKNFTTWAIEGNKSTILPIIKLLLINLINVGKPIVALCVSPVVLAKALQDSGISLHMTIGSTTDASPYDISSFQNGMEQIGCKTEEKTIGEVLVDQKNRIITAPCYMMDAGIVQIRENIKLALHALEDLVNE
jgi:enhancing lycopene biosynthesis protein 2